MNIPQKVLATFLTANPSIKASAGAQVVVQALYASPDLHLCPFPNRVLNIHPALLPSFPGMHAQRQAIEYGVKIAGCTVHIVDEGTDTGPILAQAALEVLKDDDENSLSARILELENRLYPSALQTFIAANAAKRLATGKE